jgi:hypothetical protein
MATLHAIPTGGPLNDPERTAAVQAIRFQIEDFMTAAGDELDDWAAGCEHPDVQLADARDKLARLLELVDALKVLGPPLTLAELDHTGCDTR